MDISTLKQFVNESYSMSEVLRRMSKCPNSRNAQKLKSELLEQRIDFSHFTPNGSKPTVKITKKCPICENDFEVIKGSKTETQTTCSYSCSNVFFARKRNKPERYKQYRTICFKHHKKECVVCGESLIVATHHYDGNDKNNDPINLIPLCPTHHQYWHSRYRYLVKEKVEDYRNKFISLTVNKA